MIATKVEHPTVDERRARGKEAGNSSPCRATKGGQPAADRPDPVALLEQQNETREPDLVPVRHGRMMVSPFTFYRGAAKIMAADLQGHPAERGLTVQLCGDAHLSNFGAFASPERQPVVRPQRLRRDPARPVRVRRQADGRELHDRRAEQRVREGGRQGGHDRVGGRLPTGDGRVRPDAHPGHLVRPPGRASRSSPPPSPTIKKDAKEIKRGKKNFDKARTRDSLQALSKLGERVDGQYRIVSQPPIVVPMRDLADTLGVSPDEVEPAIREQFRALPSHAAGRPAPPAREVPHRRRGAQGGRRRERRHARVHRPAAGTRRAGPAVPPGQGGDRLGARGPPAQEPLPATARRAGRPGPTHDAGRQRHLPRLDARAGTPAGTSTGASCAT